MEIPNLGDFKFQRQDIESIMPHQDPFLFLDAADVEGAQATGIYQIRGDESFLEGHFKHQPVFPASILLEALGQLGVFSLLKGPHEKLETTPDPKSVYFTSCDGVRCHRICKPGDVLEMEINVKRIRHPMFTFSGCTRIGEDRVAVVEQITLLFDYIKGD